MYTWICNECETHLWSRQRVRGGGSSPACGAWLVHHGFLPDDGRFTEIRPRGVAGNGSLATDADPRPRAALPRSDHRSPPPDLPEQLEAVLGGHEHGVVARAQAGEPAERGGASSPATT